MKLYQFEKSLTPPPEIQAPEIVTWIPPDGAIIECPSMATAMDAATRFAAIHPGHVVGVYQLVGYARVPLQPPDFILAAPGEPIPDSVDRVPEITASYEVHQADE